MPFEVEVDMILGPDETRNAQGRLCIPQGELRDELGIKIQSCILEEVGPAGCPVVRLRGSRLALHTWLTNNGYDLRAHPLTRYVPDSSHV